MGDAYELLRDATLGELALLTFLAFGMPFSFMAGVSWVLSKVVGLKAEPDRRALLTVLPAYIAVTLLSVFGMAGASFWPLIFPLAGAPIALIIYWFWRRDFRSRWYENDDEMPDGTTLENDDWKIGLLAIISLVVVAAIKVILTRDM
ncbi:MAG: hypothetical protein C0471_05155 [Erythrobacter sp.]|nr:hypothetical protein [Erythrobacter sp.]